MRLGVLATLPSENQQKTMTSVMRTCMNSSGVCSGNRFLVCSGIFHGPGVQKSQCSLSYQLGSINNPWPWMPPKQLLCKPRKIQSWMPLLPKPVEKRKQQPQVPCHVIGLKRALTWRLTNLITMQSYSTLFN